MTFIVLPLRGGTAAGDLYEQVTALGSIYDNCEVYKGRRFYTSYASWWQNRGDGDILTLELVPDPLTFTTGKKYIQVL